MLGSGFTHSTRCCGKDWSLHLSSSRSFIPSGSGSGIHHAKNPLPLHDLHSTCPCRHDPNVRQGYPTCLDPTLQEQVPTKDRNYQRNTGTIKEVLGRTHHPFTNRANRAPAVRAVECVSQLHHSSAVTIATLYGPFTLTATASFRSLLLHTPLKFSEIEKSARAFAAACTAGITTRHPQANQKQKYRYHMSLICMQRSRTCARLAPLSFHPISSAKR